MAKKIQKIKSMIKSDTDHQQFFIKMSRSQEEIGGSKISKL